MKILSLHGWAARNRSMDPLLESLGVDPKSSSILNPDLPGFGDEPEPNKAWGSQNYAIWVEELCESKKFKPDIVIGHSNGGKIALRLVSMKLIKPKLLVLVAPSFVRHEVPVWKKALNIVLNPLKFVFKNTPLRKAYYRFVLRSPDYYRLSTDVMKETFRKCVGEDLRDILYKINVPTLIFWGTKDAHTPYSDAKILNNGIKGSKLVTFKGADHFIHKAKSSEIAKEALNYRKSLNKD